MSDEELNRKIESLRQCIEDHAKESEKRDDSTFNWVMLLIFTCTLVIVLVCRK